MRVWHPDRFAGDAALQEKAGRKTQEINEAYRVLLRHDGSAPASASAAADFSSAPPPRKRGFFFDLAFLAAVLAVLFGGLYIYSLLKDSSAGTGSAVSREREWEHFFKPGSTKDEVLSVQGPPDRVSGDAWFYGADRVTFLKGLVSAYSNDGGRLRVRILPENPSALPPKYFSRGSTKDDVLALQGTPSRLEGERWYYGADYVLFVSGKVSGIVSAKGVLRAKPVAKPSVRS